MTTTIVLRNATVHDIVKRLTDTAYQTTAETALASGMGNAQNGITRALDDAIADGYVRVVTTRNTTYARNVRFVALNHGIRHCNTCIEGCDHGTNSPEGCGHLGCWSHNATSDCPGRAYAAAEAANIINAGDLV
jgi:hypothetical protein